MNYTAIFEALYTLYRAEADTPATTDDEYTICLRLANEAINRWANYDGTYWKELFTNLSDSTQVSPALVTTITTGTTDYTCPTDMREAGGLVRIKSSSGSTVQTYRIVNPEQVQFLSENVSDPTDALDWITKFIEEVARVNNFFEHELEECIKDFIKFQ